MIRDFDDFCAWMYALISDLFIPLAASVARPGPAPVCTDAELITMAIVGECCGWDQETDLLSRWGEHRDLFPHQPECSRFNRRRDLAPMINRLRIGCAKQLSTPSIWLRAPCASSIVCPSSSCSFTMCPRPVLSGRSRERPSDIAVPKKAGHL